MQLDGSQTRIRCIDGETITVRVNPNQGVAAVRYSLDGNKTDGSPFTVNQSNPPHSANAAIRALAVGVLYNGDSGGAATITLTGSNGGATSTVQVTQAPKTDTQEAEVLDMVLYRFFI